MPIGNALTNDLTRAVPRCLANDYRLDIRVSPVITLSPPSLPIFIHSSIAITRFRPRLPTISDNNNNNNTSDKKRQFRNVIENSWPELDSSSRYKMSIFRIVSTYESWLSRYRSLFRRRRRIQGTTLGTKIDLTRACNKYPCSSYRLSLPKLN